MNKILEFLKEKGFKAIAFFPKFIDFFSGIINPPPDRIALLRKNIFGKFKYFKKEPWRFAPRFAPQNQIIFAKRLAVLVKAGVPILNSLQMLEDQAGSRRDSGIIGDLRKQMEQGKSLAAGMSRHIKIFGQFAVNIVRVGEMSGTLAQNLNYLAGELKKKQELKRNIISALIYPAFIVAATIAIVIMLTVFLFPKILPVFASFNARLPWSTRALISVSDFITAYWPYFFAGIVVFLIAFALMMRIRRICHFWDRLLFRWPILGPVFRGYFLANSTRTMSLLLKSEVNILEALRIVGETSGNEGYRQAFEKIGDCVARGETVSETMKKDKLLFPLLVSQMVQVGEMTGTLHSNLMYVSEMFEDEMAVSTKNLTTSIEPVLMLFMGILVGFVALSIITPIYGITRSLQP